LDSSLSSASSATNGNDNNKSDNERTSVLYGAENVINIELQLFSNSQKRIDTCMNYTRPQLAIALDPIRNSFIDAKNRGIKLRYLTEITSENISYCKGLMSMVDELRHLDGIKGNFMLSESEYVSPVVSTEKGKVAARAIHSNVKELVEQHEYMFDTLWSKAISAEHRIREIEEGADPIRTRLLQNQDEIIREIKRLNSKANHLSICTAFGGMQMSYQYFFDTYKTIVDKYMKGESRKGLRWLTNIDDKESANLVQLFLQAGMQTRHIKNRPPLNFGVSNNEVAFTIEKMEGGKMSSSFLVSNEPLYVNHFNSVFEELWRNGIDATNRIREIEEKVEVEFVDVIADPVKVSSVLLDLAKSVKNEALCLIPTPRGMVRVYKLGVIDHIIKASQNGATVKIICPITEVNAHVVEKISKQAPDIIIMNMYADAPSGILIADGERFLQAEVKNPMAEQFSEAIGFAIYSNSRYNVKSFKSFFELLWNEHALNEELRRIEKTQKEFVDTAAHELRTPVQPILGLSDVLLSKGGDIEQYRELLDAINRNAKRLQRLTEDILDVTRIESQSLSLKEEQFNLNDVITNVINDILTSADNASLKNERNSLPIKIEYYDPQNIIIQADKGRIIQVISNLLSNALKFTKQGTISVSLQREKEEDDKDYIVISVKDTGQGIDLEILPKLFTKFATKSESGTGLGLFISKSIVESHGGRIWAENNADGKGATFAFSLPILNKQ
jgi:two-component system, OmpR family, sensor histidine kinase VicK